MSSEITKLKAQPTASTPTQPLSVDSTRLSADSRFGVYKILSPLGAGGMGQVYRARDTRLGREIAIKVLSPELSTNADFLSRFEEEARAASALNHPNIVTIYELGPIDATHYLAMELAERQTPQ